MHELFFELPAAGFQKQTSSIELCLYKYVLIKHFSIVLDDVRFYVSKNYL